MCFEFMCFELTSPFLSSTSHDVKILTKGDNNAVDDRGLYAIVGFFFFFKKKKKKNKKKKKKKKKNQQKKKQYCVVVVVYCWDDSFTISTAGASLAWTK